MAIIDISMISGIPEIGRVKDARLQTSALMHSMITKIHAVPMAFNTETTTSNTAMTRVRKFIVDGTGLSPESGIGRSIVYPSLSTTLSPRQLFSDYLSIEL